MALLLSRGESGGRGERGGHSGAESSSSCSDVWESERYGRGRARATADRWKSGSERTRDICALAELHSLLTVCGKAAEIDAAVLSNLTHGHYVVDVLERLGARFEVQRREAER